MLVLNSHMARDMLAGGQLSALRFTQEHLSVYCLSQLGDTIVPLRTDHMGEAHQDCNLHLYQFLGSTGKK